MAGRALQATLLFEQNPDGCDTACSCVCCQQDLNCKVLFTTAFLVHPLPCLLSFSAVTTDLVGVGPGIFFALAFDAAHLRFDILLVSHSTLYIK